MSNRVYVYKLTYGRDDQDRRQVTKTEMDVVRKIDIPLGWDITTFVSKLTEKEDDDIQLVNYDNEYEAELTADGLRLWYKSVEIKPGFVIEDGYEYLIEYVH